MPHHWKRRGSLGLGLIGIVGALAASAGEPAPGAPRLVGLWLGLEPQLDQGLPRSWEPSTRGRFLFAAERQQASEGAMVATGLLAGTLGFFLGHAIGMALEEECPSAPHNDDCTFDKAAYGALLGESLLLPAGVHLANSRRGHYGNSALASLGLTVLGTGVAASIDNGVPLLVVPIGQLAASIAIERGTARERKG